ncbi:MAG: diaminopimelate decarboxylase [Anaerolineales bacterium]
MEVLHYKNGVLHCENVDLREIAKVFDTPCYLYSLGSIEQNFSNFEQALSGIPHLICFAVKANNNLSILRHLAQMGAGADVVSGGELYKAQRAGIATHKIVYSGVGKTISEIRYALQSGILMFNIESEAELNVIQNEAEKLNLRPKISIRVNPDVDPKTHPYIATGLRKNKFGIAMEKAIPLYLQTSKLPQLEISGIACHIGSQITSLEPFADAFDIIHEAIQELEKHHISLQFIDLGGGLGIRYSDEIPPTPSSYAELIRQKFAHLNKTIILEPGRAIIGDTGFLLTKIIYIKENHGKRFYIVDAAMNDLIRPSLYQAYHEIIPIREPVNQTNHPVDVVGPICESGDYLARDRLLPELHQGDLLLIQNCGAYGFSMASNYNARARAAEVLISHNDYRLIRKRETLESLIENEIGLDNSGAGKNL